LQVHPVGLRAHRLRALPGRRGNRRPRGHREGPRAFLPLLTRATLWAAELGGGSPPPSSTPGAVTEVGPGAVPALEAAMGDQRHLAGLRLARGCRCFGAWLGEEMAGYGWLSAGPEWIGELGLEIRPPPGEAYVWNCVTLPAHRRRGLFRALLLGVAAIAGREGIARLWLG